MCTCNPLRTHATPPSVPGVLPAHKNAQILLTESCEEKATKQCWYRNIQTFIGIFGFIWFWSHVLPGFCLSSQGWQISWKHVNPACKHGEFPRATNHTKPVIALSLPRSKYEITVEVRFLASQGRKQGVQIRSLTPTCHLLTPESILSSSYTSEMALDQVIVTLDSINVRMCDATVAYVPSDWHISSKS